MALPAAIAARIAAKAAQAGAQAKRIGLLAARNPVKTAAAVHAADSIFGAVDDPWEYQEVKNRFATDSTAIERIGYNRETQQLRIIFKGKTPPYPEYQWEGISPETWYHFQIADSKGKFYHTWIKEHSSRRIN